MIPDKENRREVKSPLVVTGVVCAALSIGLALDKNVHTGIKLGVPTIGFLCCLVARHGVRHELTDIEEQFQDRWEGIDLRESQLLDREEEYRIALNRLENEKRTLHNDHVARLNALREAEQRYKDQYQNWVNELQSEHAAKLAELDKDRRIFEKEKELQEALLTAKKDQIATQLHEQNEQRRSELDDKEARINHQIAKANEQLADIQDQLESEYQARLAQFSEEKQFLMEKHSKEIDSWKQRYKDAQTQIAISKAPKFPLGGDEIASHECIKVIRYLWTLETPIKVDCHERQPQNQGNKDVFWLTLRDATQLSILKSKVDEIQYILGKGHKPIIDQERGESTIRVELKRNTEPGIVLKVSKQDVEEKIPTLAKHKNGKRGWLVTGHPGAGKTSVLIWLGQLIGGEDCDRVALNPHNDEFSMFKKYGYHEITELSLIYSQLELLAEELNLRGQDPTRRRKLIVVVDELGKILSNAEDPQRVMEIIRQINVEGRKLEMVILVGNHSQTTTAIKMDAEFRSAFYQLFLVGAARELIKKPNAPELQDLEKQWLHDTAYPTITLINGQYSICLHPTHWNYTEYRDSGNPPKGLQEMKTLPLSVAIAGQETVINYGLTDAEIVQIEQHKHLSVAQIIYEIWGIKQSKYAKYTSKRDLVEKYLQNYTQIH
ncbi:hypothetical protein F7734_52850 [Scytonema sp. UIC 10036]|uniref:zonular occludens toxin domain-containing protein n=1 Tax=Scytonema sp. UIC 10036 TaxID=2304196 RepID=UPI0012DAAC61|nr:hypothetical protein [Scytonema sp. UIC 10036]MUH00505.1 hypothetical protein [Scytonema sp. UIC 10036]